jgi:hypothetical protein
MSEKERRAGDPASTSKDIGPLLHDELPNIRALAATHLSATTDQLELALVEDGKLIEQIRFHDNAPLRLVAELRYIDVSPRAQERFVAAIDGDTSRLVGLGHSSER